MKKLLYVLLPALAATMVSCEIDNYKEPNAGVRGRFLDSKDNTTLIGTDINNGNEITVYEQGWSAETAQTWKVDNTGEYTNTRVFAADYRIEFLNTNFYPYKGENIITIKKGQKNVYDFVVTPFLRVIDPKISYDAATKTITAKCRIEAGGSDVTLGELRLFVFTDKWVGNSIHSGIGGTAVAVQGDEIIDSGREYTMTIKVSDHKDFFKYSREYFFRIGARANGPSSYGNIRHNYSPLVVINI